MDINFEKKKLISQANLDKINKLVDVDFTSVEPFKQQFLFERRIEESTRVLQKHSNKVPIVCEKNINQRDLPNIVKKKYLVPTNFTVCQFLYIIRQQIKHLRPEEALVLFINGWIPSSNKLIGEIYHRNKDADGFLYITYSKENTFG